MMPLLPPLRQADAATPAIAAIFYAIDYAYSIRAAVQMRARRENGAAPKTRAEPRRCLLRYAAPGTLSGVVENRAASHEGVRSRALQKASPASAMRRQQTRSTATADVRYAAIVTPAPRYAFAAAVLRADAAPLCRRCLLSPCAAMRARRLLSLRAR
jgi:hypothetical protein